MELFFSSMSGQQATLCYTYYTKVHNFKAFQFLRLSFPTDPSMISLYALTAFCLVGFAVVGAAINSCSTLYGAMRVTSAFSTCLQSMPYSIFHFRNHFLSEPNDFRVLIKPGSHVFHLCQITTLIRHNQSSDIL